MKHKLLIGVGLAVGLALLLGCAPTVTAVEPAAPRAAAAPVSLLPPPLPMSAAVPVPEYRPPPPCGCNYQHVFAQVY